MSRPPASQWSPSSDDTNRGFSPVVQQGSAHVQSNWGGTVAVAPPVLPMPKPFYVHLLDFLKVFWEACVSNKKVAFGSAIVLFFLLVAIIGPLFIKIDPNFVTPNSNLPPSAEHWLGTTSTGQDVFIQLVIGTRNSMLWGMLTGLAVTVISVLVGMVSGYFGGVVDEVLSLLTNVFLVLPALPLAIVLASYFPRGALTVAVIITFTNWAWGARVMRSVTLSMRSREFVTAARASGESIFRIIFFELFPNQISIVAAGFVSTTVFVIVYSASLDFLGLGDFNNVTWGAMLFWAQKSNTLLLGQWWWFVPPGLCIALLGTGLALINFGIDEIADPRLRSERIPKVLRRALKEKKVVA